MPEVGDNFSVMIVNKIDANKKIFMSRFKKVKANWVYFFKKKQSQ